MGTRTESLGDRPKISRMPMIAEASQLLRETAGPGPVGDTIKRAITRATDAVNDVLRTKGHRELSYGRAENIWRREARRIDAHEIDAIRAAHAAARSGVRPEVQRLEALAHRLSAMAAASGRPLAGPEADQLREAADEARASAHALRRLAAEAHGR